MDTWNGVDRGGLLPRFPVFFRDSLQLAVLSNAERGINITDEFVIEEYGQFFGKPAAVAAVRPPASLCRTSTAILSLNNDIIKLNNSLHGRIFKQLDIDDDIDNNIHSFPFIQCWYDLRSIKNYEFYDIEKKSKSDYAHIMSNFLQSQYLIWNNKFSFVSLLNNDCDSAFQMISAIRRSQRLDRLLFHYNSQGIFNEVLLEGSKLDPPCFYLSCSGVVNVNLKAEDTNTTQMNTNTTNTKANIDLFAPQNTHFSAVDFDKFLSQLSSPNIVVFDSSYSGSFVDYLENSNKAFANFAEVIVMASCGRTEELPVFSQKIPSDLFTSCLTTPIKTAIFHYQHKLFNETDTHEYITGARLRAYLQKSHFFSFGPRSCCSLYQMVSGNLSDRNTMLGQLNWILIAVTDSIAYSSLDYSQFRVLFRSDLFLASMMRNYIFACYVLRHFLLRPQIYVSSGVSMFDKTSRVIFFDEGEFYEKVVNHSLWACWEYHLNFMLQQMPANTPVDYINDITNDMIINRVVSVNVNNRKDSGSSFEDSTFFMDFLHSFSNYIDHCNGLFYKNHQMDNSSDCYLTVLLQSLLGQKFRFDSIKVLTKYFDMSPNNDACVVNSLRVGFFPYLQKMINYLLHKMEYSEMDGFAVFLWSKLIKYYPEYVTVDCNDYKLLYSLENFYYHLLDIFYKKIEGLCGNGLSVSPSFKEYQLLLFFFILTRHLGNIYSDGSYKNEQLQRISYILFSERIVYCLKKFFQLCIICINSSCKDKMYTVLHLFMLIYHLSMCNVYFYSRSDNKLLFVSEEISLLRNDVNMHFLHTVLNFYNNNSIEIYFALNFSFLSLDMAEDSAQFINSFDKKILIENLNLIHFNMHVNVRNEIIMGILKICIKHLKNIVQLMEFFFDIYSRQLANMIYYTNKNHSNYNITSANQLFNANANIFNLNLSKARRYKIFDFLPDELIPPGSSIYQESPPTPTTFLQTQNNTQHTIIFLFEKLFFQTDLVFEEANFYQSMDDGCLLLLSFRYLISLILIEGSNDVENFNFLNIFVNPILSKYTYTNAHTVPLAQHLAQKVPTSANTVTTSNHQFKHLFSSDAKRSRSKPLTSSNSPHYVNTAMRHANFDAASVVDVNTSSHSLSKKRFTISSFFGAISKKSSVDPFKSLNPDSSAATYNNTNTIENESNEMFYFESHESGALVNVNEYVDILNSEIKEQLSYGKPINFKMRINMENNLLLFRSDLSEKINNIFERQSSMTYMSTAVDHDQEQCLFNSYQDMGFTNVNRYESEQHLCNTLTRANSVDYLFEQKNLHNLVFKSNNNYNSRTFVKFHTYNKSCYVFNGDQLTVHDLSEKKNNYTCKINRSVLESTSVVDMFAVNAHVKFCDSDHGTVGYATSDGIVRIVKLKNGDDEKNKVKCLSWFRAGYPLKNVDSLEAFSQLSRSNDYPAVVVNFDQYSGQITTLCGCDDKVRLFDVNRGVQVEQIDLKNSGVHYTSMVNMSVNEYYVANSVGDVLRVDRRESNAVSEVITEGKLTSKKKKVFGVRRCNEEFYAQCDQTLNIVDESLNSYVFDLRENRLIYNKRVNKKFSTQIDGLNSVRLYSRGSVCEGCRGTSSSCYAYIDSKTSNVYFAGEETRRLATQHSRVQMKNQDKSKVTVQSFDFHDNYNMMALGYSNGMVEFISQK